jgi:hypothetical protein
LIQPESKALEGSHAGIPPGGGSAVEVFGASRRGSLWLKRRWFQATFRTGPFAISPC